MSEQREALFYTPHSIHCTLCPHNCVIAESHSGFCGVRANRNGRLYADSYGLISSCALDPIEKKPLFHFYPGSLILSIGSYGCNMRCSFCQNHTISMSPLPVDNFQYLTPEEVAALAERYVPNGNIGVAYTYNEPSIGYEFVRDCAERVRERGLKNVLVTNGYIQTQPLMELLPFIDALNIDLKAYNDDFYRKAGAPNGLEMVKQTIALAAANTHVEVTTLIIPGENDSESEMEAMAQFIAHINPDIPLHLSRFFPCHLMTDKPPTPKETILKLKIIAEKYLRYVYPGNMR